MLSDNIRNYRKKNNMSQDELAEKLGISRQSVSLWETGQSQPTIENVLALSKIFDVSTDALLKDADEPSDTADERRENDPGRKSKRVIAIACAVAAVLVVGAVILIALSGKSAGEDAYESAEASDISDAYIPVGAEPEDSEISVEEAVSLPDEVSEPEAELDLFEYCKNFAIKIGHIDGDCAIYQQPAKYYGGYDGEYFSISYWADSNMVEFCLHCPLSDTQSINFFLRMRGGYNHRYEYLSSRYYRDSGASIRSLSGYIDPAVFSDRYPLSWGSYEGDGGIDKQNAFIEESRVGICDLIHCLKEFVEAEQMECSFSDFEFVNF